MEAQFQGGGWGPVAIRTESLVSCSFRWVEGTTLKTTLSCASSREGFACLSHRYDHSQAVHEAHFDYFGVMTVILRRMFQAASLDKHSAFSHWQSIKLQNCLKQSRSARSRGQVYTNDTEPYQACITSIVQDGRFIPTVPRCVAATSKSINTPRS